MQYNSNKVDLHPSLYRLLWRYKRKCQPPPMSTKVSVCTPPKAYSKQDMLLVPGNDSPIHDLSINIDTPIPSRLVCPQVPSDL